MIIEICGAICLVVCTLTLAAIGIVYLIGLIIDMRNEYEPKKRKKTTNN